MQFLKFFTIAAAFCAALLTACGGGGGDTPIAITPPAVVAPVITQQPTSITVGAGASAAFTVGATGEALAFQWLRGSQEIAGVTSSAYSIPNVQASDNGSSFSVKVANAGGMVTSTAAVLTVSQPTLVLTTQPISQSVRVGNTATFTVVAAGPSSITYQWYADAAAIPGATSSTFTLAPVQQADNQRVYLVVVTAASEVVTSAAATLTVLALPQLSLLAGDLGAVTSATSPSDVDATGAAARFSAFFGMAADAAGNVYVAESTVIRKISPAGVVTTLAGTLRVGGYADGIGIAARFASIESIVVDAAGDLIVADAGNAVIRRVSSSGVVSTIAGVARNRGYADGSAGTARFVYPTGVAVDASGSIYVADGEYGANYIRKLTSTGAVSTVAGGIFTNIGTGSKLAVDQAGNIYATATTARPGDVFFGVVSPYSVQAAYLRKITPAGEVSVFAGSTTEKGSIDGTAGSARFALPTALAFDAAGNLLVADADSNSIRRVSPTGAVTTVVGVSQSTSAGVTLGPLPGQVQSPNTVDVGPGGVVYLSAGRSGIFRPLGLVVLKAEGL